MIDFNNRILEEISHLRHLQSKGIINDRITHCLEILRYIRNSELDITFEQGFEEENRWITKTYIEVTK